MKADPCPFCGCNYLLLFGGLNERCVRCPNCQARGPNIEGERHIWKEDKTLIPKAVTAWNKRLTDVTEKYFTEDEEND